MNGLTIRVFVFGVLAVASLAAEDGKVRVFIGNSESWQTSRRSGGNRNQTPELMKTFAERCTRAVITNNEDKADFTVTFSHEGGKGWARMDNKVAVFNKDGDMIYSGATRSLGNSVKDACAAISK